MTRRFQTLLRDTSGAAVVELALVAPVLAMVTVGIVDLSNAYSRQLALEQGAQRAIEKIMQTTELSTVENTLKDEACFQVDGINADGTCKNSPITTNDVTVTFRQECTDSSGTVTVQTTHDGTTFDGYSCASGSTEAKYIQVSISDKYTPMFPIHFSGYDEADGSYHFTATAGMRTK